jgi:hypothetical protein
MMCGMSSTPEAEHPLIQQSREVLLASSRLQRKVEQAEVEFIRSVRAYIIRVSRRLQRLHSSEVLGSLIDPGRADQGEKDARRDLYRAWMSRTALIKMYQESPTGYVGLD